MASRPRAPRTARLRGRLARGAARAPPPVVEELDAAGAAEFASHDGWLLVTAQDAVAPDGGVVEAEAGEGEGKLSKALCALAVRFEEEGRPYRAMAAREGARLAAVGREDDINPGLWACLREREAGTENMAGAAGVEGDRKKTGDCG